MIRIFKTGLSSSSDSPEGLTAELGQQTSPGRRGFGPKSSGHRSPGGGASILANKRLTLPFLAFVAVLAAGLLFLLPGGLLQAQDSTTQDSATIEYAEGGTDPVVTFTATDPEGAMPITWSVLADDATDPEGVDAGVDSADATHFDISKDGVLTFDIGGDDDTGDMSMSPDFEAPRNTGPVSVGNTNTYKVVVAACDVMADDCADGMMGYHKVTVKVTNVAEKGKVSWTVDADGGGGPNMPKLMQFQAEALLTASATDGDMEGTTKTVANPTWRWYRGSTLISGEEVNTYTVTTADVGSRLRVVAAYNAGDSTTRETASLTSDYPVLAVRAGVNKLKFDPAEVSREVAEGKKGMKVGAPVTATGNHGAVNYTLVPGDDTARFKIDPKTGQITTDVDLDYDAAEANQTANCRDTDRCTVMVKATDASGDDTEATANVANNVFADATVTIKLTDVDEKPTFDSDTDAMSPMRITREENNTPLFEDGASGGQAETAVDVTYMATDPEGLNVNLTLMGPDAAKFSLSSNGELSFKYKPDYEKPADANKDNVYEVTVRASDGTMYEDRMVMVTVTPVDEAPEIIGGGLVISGASSRDYPEKGTVPVGTYTASGPEAASVRWTLEGDDAGDFRFSSSSGMSTMLMFSSSPNYEMPRDADTDNTYMVTLKANDGENMDTHAVRVTVTDEEEAGRVALSSMTPVVGAALTATLTDYDGSISDVTWMWDTSSDMSTWAAGSGTDEANADGTASTYTPDSADDGMYLRATAMYTDGYDSGNEETATTTSAVTAGDPLVIRYDINPRNGMIDKSEVIAAINEYLDAGAAAPSKAEVIRLINLYLDG